ncbi:MAG TPA: alpha/beta hydrolase [Candidatus Saccharibacteria bacterium]|nr:alpha/beta hydrolase [Candidatus Saccharibacteria bacterium]
MTTHSPLPLKLSKGQGTPLVLLHGLGTNHTSWQFVLEHIDYNKWHVIALDLLGFGDAPKPDSVDYTPRDHAAAVIATLDKLGIDRAVFAGHSMGCLVAIDIANNWPDRVESMVLLGAPLYKVAPKGGSWWRKITRAEGLYFSLFEVIKNNPNAVQAGGKLANELLPFVKGMEITDETWPAFKKSLEHTIMQATPFQQAASLRVPTLFVNGLLDVFIIRRNTWTVHRANRQYTQIKRVLGPHELTPRQGRTIARHIDKFAKKNI